MASSSGIGRYRFCKITRWNTCWAAYQLDQRATSLFGRAVPGVGLERFCWIRVQEVSMSAKAFIFRGNKNSNTEQGMEEKKSADRVERNTQKVEVQRWSKERWVYVSLTSRTFDQSRLLRLKDNKPDLKNVPHIIALLWLEERLPSIRNIAITKHY